MNLNSKRIAIMATDGFEHSELFVPLEKLKNAGADVEIVSPEMGSIKSWKNNDWGESVEVNKTIRQANPSDYDALVLPGGVINPDLLRKNKEAINFIKIYGKEVKKPIAAICHAPWLLAEAGLAELTKVTCYDSIKTDIMNAGARWVNEPVVHDRNIITSRNPDDLDQFVEKIIETVQ